MNKHRCKTALLIHLSLAALLIFAACSAVIDTPIRSASQDSSDNTPSTEREGDSSAFPPSSPSGLEDNSCIPDNTKKRQKSIM